jgi:hypothetical protein
MRAFTDWTARQMGSAAARMKDWPDHAMIPDAELHHWVYLTHASLAGNRAGIMRHHSDDDLRNRVPTWASLFVTAHTHRPLLRQLDDTAILNVGSAGSPFDGDPRGSWAKLVHDGQDWQTEIIRFEYDRNRAEADFHDTGFLAQCGPFGRLVFEEWKQARSLLPHWRRRYFDAVENGEISLEQSVTAFLENDELPDNNDTSCCA